MLKGKKLDDSVIAEVTVSNFENEWVTFAGLDEVINLLEGRVQNLYAIPEGTAIPYRDCRGTPVPFLSIHGNYTKFGMLETSILGFICQASGIATKASRIRAAAGDKLFISMGIRRMHPSIAPMIDRSAYIGGADSVSGITGAKLLGIEPAGTMPHALSLLLGEEEAWKLVSKHTKGGPVTVLIDTYDDEKFAAIRAADLIPNLNFIRLDTPSSRRGNFASIIREVRWELDLRGYQKVKIMVSGGITENEIPTLIDAGAEAFGVGTAISSGKTVDFALDIVSLAGKPGTKKGKFSGSKDVLRCDRCGMVLVVPWPSKSVHCDCGGSMNTIFVQYISNGKIKIKDSAKNARERALLSMQKLFHKKE